MDTKRNYISPECEEIELKGEQVLAGSSMEDFREKEEEQGGLG